jgi:hypothetical protein
MKNLARNPIHVIHDLPLFGRQRIVGLYGRERGHAWPGLDVHL